MDNGKLNIGKVFFKAVIRTLEDFLNIDEEVHEKENKTEQFFKNYHEKIENVKVKKVSEKIPIRKSKRKTRTPIRYGYDE